MLEAPSYFMLEQRYRSAFIVELFTAIQ